MGTTYNFLFVFVKTSWEEQLRIQKQEASQSKKRCQELDEQNKVLHEQIQAVSMKYWQFARKDTILEKVLKHMASFKDKQIPPSPPLSHCNVEKCNCLQFVSKSVATLTDGEWGREYYTNIDCSWGEWWKIIVPEVNSRQRLNFTEGTIIVYHSPNKRAVNICFIHPIHRFCSPYRTVKYGK